MATVWDEVLGDEEAVRAQVIDSFLSRLNYQVQELIHLSGGVWTVEIMEELYQQYTVVMEGANGQHEVHGEVQYEVCLYKLKQCTLCFLRQSMSSTLIVILAS